MTVSQLRGPVCKVFWAYFLIYIDFNLGTLSILPAWAGYLMLYFLLNTLGTEQPTLKLLRPFALALAANAVYEWLDKAFGGGLPDLPGWMALAVGLVTMYFHFQLFTDLADLARRRGIDPVNGGLEGGASQQNPPPPCRVRGLLNARTLQALLHTGLLIDPLMRWLQSREALLFVTLAVYIAVLFVILYQLYALRRLFPEAEPAAA